MDTTRATLVPNFVPGTQRGTVAIESVPIKTGKALATLRKAGTAYAKRFSIPFCDKTV
jgi:hypothetical protein